jgi:1,4-alpha-glucan branching enzyme
MMTSKAFCLVLHTHLPFVLGHGRWPHGSDWLSEAALECYLPLLDAARRLTSQGLSPKWTISLSPVLVEQLASQAFRKEFEFFIEHRLRACQENRDWFRQSGASDLERLADYWETFITKTWEQYRKAGGDLVGEFAELQREGHLEVMTCAATHGYLPLLSTDESIRLQIRTAVETHRARFGQPPRGIWLPECAYRPRGEWSSPTGAQPAQIRTFRPGLEELLDEHNLRFFVTDAHLARGGQALSQYSEQFPALTELQSHVAALPLKPKITPYRLYRIASPGGKGSAVAFVRDPETTRQVWSRHEGYPGDPEYLEFHKKHFPGGLRYWRVTDAHGDLGSKTVYEPSKAADRARDHGRHFAGLVEDVLGGGDAGSILCAPFDAELFGHWWFEGPDWLVHVARELQARGVVPQTLSEAMASAPPLETLTLAEGSWGEGGDHRVWINKDTTWTWEKIYEAERQLVDLLSDWRRSPSALLTRIVTQASRELLLLEASDWQFLITTWSARDYAERRVNEHFSGFCRLAALAHRVLSQQSLSSEDEEFLSQSEQEDFPFPSLDPVWAHSPTAPH